MTHKFIDFNVRNRITILILTLFVDLFITACSSDKEESSSQEKFPVTNPILRDTLFTSEYVADIQSIQNVEIRARVRGYMEAIHADEGQDIKAGQLLFSISSQEYKLELLKAKAVLANAIAEAKATEVNLNNVKTLVEKNIVSKSELDLAQAKWGALQAKIEEAKAHEASAQLSLSFTQIKAPFSGIINRIPKKVGSLIEGGTLLTIISNNNEVFAYFNLSEREYLEFARRNDADKNKEVLLMMADHQIHNHKGTIETVESEVDKNTGTIAFRARFPNPGHLLKHGSSGKVMLTNELKNALVIPQKSTFEIQENTYVYVVDSDNVVRMRSIVPKLRLPHLYVIESGLSSEDRILYEGIQRVKDGDRIRHEFKRMDQILHQLAKQ